MLTALLIGAALAADPAQDAGAEDWSAVVDAAADLAAAGQVEQAHAAIDLALRQPLPDALRDQAQAVRADLPLSRKQLDAMTQLAVGQALAGAYLAGPHVARLSWDPSRSATPYYLGAIGGAAIGAGTGIWLGSRPGFDMGEAHTMLTAEVLGGATGVAVGYLVDKHDHAGPAWGVLVGTGAGVGIGLALSRFDPSPTAAFAAQSGALWGTGLATAGLIFVEGGETPQGVVVPLVIGADVGAALGVLVADQLDLTTRQLAFADLGAGLGGGAGGLIIAIIATDNDVSPEAGSTLVAGMAVAGGIATAVIAGPGDSRGGPLAAAALSGSPGDLRVALPIPSLSADRAALRLVDVSF